MEKIPAILMLEDGTTYHGNAIGAIGTTTGEIAFNTGMTGYQEIFTDPSYFGQILIMNSTHIGNYGVHNGEIESDTIQIAGLITKNFSEIFSRVGNIQSLQENLVNEHKVGITDIDTRSLVRHIREKGAMNALISSDNTSEEELKEILNNAPNMDGLELSSKVATKSEYIVSTDNPKYKVALLDFGTKKNIIRCLTDRNCEVKVFPLNSKLEDVLYYNPDGIMLSNGPGDPAAMGNQIEKVKLLVEKNIPTFGICLGHQILGLSQSLKTEKMFNGHRGINHPIKNIKTGKGEITSQNHGFVISKDSVDSNSNIELTHIHLNDDTVAGIKIKNKPIFSVQYHPEASAGPHDSRYLFDEFIDLMKK